jgi:hypothetical protein
MLSWRPLFVHAIGSYLSGNRLNNYVIRGNYINVAFIIYYTNVEACG